MKSSRKSSRSIPSALLTVVSETVALGGIVTETTQATATATVDAPAPSTLATDGTVQAPAPTKETPAAPKTLGEMVIEKAELNKALASNELSAEQAVATATRITELSKLIAAKMEANRLARIDALYVAFANEVGTRENKFAPLGELSQADAWEMLAKWSRYVNFERMDKPDFSKLPGCTTPDDATESQKKGAKVARALALQTVQDFNKPTLGLFRLNTDARASRFAGESTEKRTERVLKSGKVIIGQNIRTAYEVPSACGYAFTTRG